VQKVVALNTYCDVAASLTFKLPHSTTGSFHSHQFHTTELALLRAANVWSRGATTFSKLGVQFLALGYCTEQNTDGIPSFVDCSLLRNSNHTLHQKIGVVRPKFGGPDPLNPQWLRPWFGGKQYTFQMSSAFHKVVW